MGEYAQYHSCKGHSLPTAFTGRLSGMMGKVLSKCQSIIEKSSLVTTAGTDEGAECTFSVDYIKTASSYGGEGCSSELSMQHLLTGGAADGWYQASLPLPSSPLTTLCFGPMMPLLAPAATCVAKMNQAIVPSLVQQAACMPVVNDSTAVPRKGVAVAAIVQKAETPPADDPASNRMTSERTPLRPTAAPYQPQDAEQTVGTPAEEAPKTTLLLKNLPAELTRNMLMDLLRSKGFAHHIAFLYLPMNLRGGGNFGYAFVDFDSMGAAEQCMQKLEGFTGWDETGDRPLELAWSETQGLDSHIQRYRDSPLMHESLEDEFKPAMFKNGERIAFPPPTKPIRAPRLRKAANRSSQ